MPTMDRDAAPDGPIVRGFKDKGYLVADRHVPGGLILTPTDALDWDRTSIDALTAADAQALPALSPPPEFLLLGTGLAMRRPPAAFAAAFEARGIGIEVMDSRAAARAWGVLRGEGRWIMAALLPL